MTDETTIGLLYPGHSAEDDFDLLVRRAGGRLRLPLVHTAMASDAHRPEELRAWGAPEVLARGAAELLAAERVPEWTDPGPETSPESSPETSPEAIVWTCTSGSFVFGWGGAQRQADQLADGCGRPASSTSLAFVRALRFLGLSRVAVAASYPADVAQLFTGFLADAAIDVVALGVQDIVLARDVGGLVPDQVLAMVRAADRPDAEAVLVPDTAMHTLAVVDACEAAIGKPVLTANQVSVWEGLRLLGRTLPVPNTGRLFAGAAG